VSFGFKQDLLRALRIIDDISLYMSYASRFDFPFGSYSLAISFRLRSTELSMSEHSIREKSLNWLGVSYRAQNKDMVKCTYSKASSCEHGWKDGKLGLELILFEDQMSSDFLQDLVCLDISFRLRSTELSMSEHSIREKSLNWLGVSYRAFNIDFFPIPKNEEVVSHPGKIGNCQRFYFGETSSEWRHI
jgi:hypothetical protein